MGAAPGMRAVLVRFGGASLRLQIMTGTAVAAITALVLVVLWADRELPARPETGDMLRVGVVEGQSVSGYLHSSRDELARLTGPSAPVTGEIWALVAFHEYTEAGLLAQALAGSQAAQVYTRAPLAGVRTAVTRIPVLRLPADVTAGMLAAAAARDRERAEYERLSGELTGSGRNETRLRTAYGTAARAAAEEAAAYRAGCACAFAAVVRGTPAALDVIAARPRVRVVDPAPEVWQPDRVEFRPPLPEETEVASPDPASSGVPSPPAGVASGAPGPLPPSIGTDVTSASPDDSGVTPSVAVFPSEGPVAVPSATDTNPAHEGPDVSPGASSGTDGR